MYWKLSIEVFHRHEVFYVDHNFVALIFDRSNYRKSDKQARKSNIRGIKYSYRERERERERMIHQLTRIHL